jgi:hypothetical protein
MQWLALLLLSLTLSSCGDGMLINLNDPVFLYTPVESVRRFTTGLSLLPDGDAMFIDQSYNYPLDVPTTFSMVKLRANTYRTVLAETGVYANTLYNVKSENTDTTITNQLMAANGRIFFMCKSSATFNLWYFDPEDQDMHLVTLGAPNNQVFGYTALFSYDGETLYMGTQADATFKPVIYIVNTNTLEWDVITDIGKATGAAARYAYQMAKDGGGGDGADWLYVATGELTWQLIAIKLSTKEQFVLAETTTGNQRVSFEYRNQGIRADVTENGVVTSYWVTDGELSPYPGSGAPPSGARAVEYYQNDPVGLPEVDWSEGTGHVGFREAGSGAAYTERSYDVGFTSPINLESLLVLEDGSVVGNAVSYQGVFLDGESFNAWQGLSQPALLEYNGLVYWWGYPNGNGYVWNLREAWVQGSNPASIGSFFFTAGVKYVQAVTRNDDLVYMFGRKERDAIGASIGIYSLTTNNYGLSTSYNLIDYDPLGIVVTGDRVVTSTSPTDISGLTDNKMMVYDLSLNEITRFTVPDAGRVHAGPAGKVILVGAAGVYRINIATGEIDKTIAGACGSSVDYDGYLWVVIDRVVTRIDVITFAYEGFGPTLDFDPIISWGSSKLYLAAGPSVYSMDTLIGQPPGGRIPPRLGSLLPYPYTKLMRQQRRRR